MKRFNIIFLMVSVGVSSLNLHAVKVYNKTAYTIILSDFVVSNQSEIDRSQVELEPNELITCHKVTSFKAACCGKKFDFTNLNAESCIRFKHNRTCSFVGGIRTNIVTITEYN